MNKTSEKRIDELVEAMNNNAVTYNGFVLTKGTWSRQDDERPGVNRLIFNCNVSGIDTINKISIRNASSVKVKKLDGHNTAYIVSCRPRPENGNVHIFYAES